MAERKLRRVESTEVQGEGSFVEFRGLPYAIYREAVRRVEHAPKDAQGNAQVTFADNDAHLREVLETTVARWNWVDDTGQPMPTPANGLALDTLMLSEVNWLYAQAVGGSTSGTAAKN